MPAKYFLINDFSKEGAGNHAGCKAVTASIEAQQAENGHERVYREQDADYAIVNGEGTIHHCTAPNRAAHIRKRIINPVSYFRNHKKPYFVVNSLIQAPSKSIVSILKGAKRVEVRELKSWTCCDRAGVEATIIPDLAWFYQKPLPKSSEVLPPVAGCFFRARNRKVRKAKNSFCDKAMNINTDWNAIRAELNRSKLYVTGRHHGIYAAVSAGCRFTTFDHNSWKIESLLLTCGANQLGTPETNHELTVQITRILAGEFETEFDKVRNWMHSFQSWHGVTDDDL